MACGLEVDELFILNVLYGSRCLRKNRSYNLGQIASNFRAKGSTQNKMNTFIL